MSDLPIHSIIPRAEVDAAAKASFARMQALLAGRMSDADGMAMVKKLARIGGPADLLAAIPAMLTEFDRARAAELALMARVAALEAERERLESAP